MGSCRLEDDACCFLSGVRCVSIAAYALLIRHFRVRLKPFQLGLQAHVSPSSLVPVFLFDVGISFFTNNLSQTTASKSEKNVSLPCIVLDCKPTDKIRRIY